MRWTGENSISGLLRMRWVIDGVDEISISEASVVMLGPKVCEFLHMRRGHVTKRTSRCHRIQLLRHLAGTPPPSAAPCVLLLESGDTTPKGRNPRMSESSSRRFNPMGFLISPLCLADSRNNSIINVIILGLRDSASNYAIFRVIPTLIF
jgi:hypothetical protein